MGLRKYIEPIKRMKKKDLILLNIEASLNLIPYVGGFLATYFGEVRSRRVVERMNKFFYYFGEKLAEIDKSKIDFEYLKSEEFAELFAQGSDLVAKSATDEKITRFANILLNHAKVDFKFRDRTQSIMSFVDRLNDLDSIILISFGPYNKSFRADSKKEAYRIVRDFVLNIGISCPEKNDVFESIIYLDNLGLMWVNEKETGKNIEKGQDLILKDFSSFRTPLGSEIVKVIVPSDFFTSGKKDNKNISIKNFINRKYIKNNVK